MNTPANEPDESARPTNSPAQQPTESEAASTSMLDRETYGQMLDQPAPDDDTSDLTSGLNQPASQHFGNEEQVPGEENPNT
jgi:hypothetical protein